MFHWKEPKDIFKGEGVYHLTYVVRPRRPVLGELVMDERNPRVALTPWGITALKLLERTEVMRPNIRIYATQMMPDHIHLLLHVKQDIGESAKELARGICQGWRKAVPGLDFEPAFIRTLARRGQLNALYTYIHDNPRRALLKRLHPDLFSLRRNLPVKRGDLSYTFSALGNPFLLDYPERQQVQCSRSLTEEQIEAMGYRVVDRAVRYGAITYSGAISQGEQLIMRTIRQHGYPMVILLKDGFPPAGSPHERYYKPGGIYFEACAAGRLLLLEPTAETLASPTLIDQTEALLHAKAEAKHFAYSPLPHDSTRWRMMANNALVAWMTEELSPLSI